MEQRKNRNGFSFIKKNLLIAIAKIYKHKRQHDVAAIFYGKALDNHDGLRASLYYEYAYVLYATKKFEQALEQINYAIDTSQKSYSKYIVLRAQIQIKLKQFAKAEKDLQQSLAINYEKSITHYLLGISLIFQEKWYQAKEALMTAEQLGYHTAKFYHRLGQASFELEHFSYAAGAYEQAASMWSSTVDSHLTISELYYLVGLSNERMGATEESQVFYDKALAYDEKLNRAQLGIGVLHHTYSQYDLAIKAYAGMDEAEPLHQLAILYEQLGDAEKAISTNKKVLSLDQVPSKYHFSLGSCYETIGNYQAAADYYRQAILRRSDYNHQWHVKLLNALHKSGDTKAYEQTLAEANFVADYVNKVYDNDRTKMSRAMRYNTFYDNRQIVEKTVLFESMSGNRVSGNPLAIFKHMLEDDRFNDYTFIWAVNNDNVVPAVYKNLPNVIFVIRYTDQFYNYLATASMLINNVTFPDFFILRDGQSYLNTWHGTPWKKLGYDVEEAKMDFANSARNFLQATHLILPNQYTYHHQIVPYQVAGIYPGELAVTGYPRIDLTYETMKNPQMMKEALDICDDKKIILYAPTWRGEKSFIDFDRQTLEHDLQQLSLLDAHVMFRGHHLAESLLQDLNRTNVTIVPEKFDTNEMLGIADILITDYSSVFFDFLVTDKPIIHYVYDYEEYAKERGLYFGLEELPGEVTQSSDQMIAAAANYLKTSYHPTEKYLKAKAEYVYKDDGNVTKRVVDWFVFDEDDVDIAMKDTTKKKILVHAGSFQPNGITSAFINLVRGIDKDQYDITITLSDSIINDQARLDQLDRLRGYVNIMPKTGSVNRAEEGHVAENMIKSGMVTDGITQISQNDYQKEYKRLFGNVAFDYIIDYSGYSVYYSRLLVSKPNREARNIIYVHNDIYSEYINRFPKLRRIFEQYKQFTEILSVSKPTSELNKDNLSNAFNIPVDKFDYIENVQDPAAVMEKSVLPLEDIADEKLFANDETIFITLGRLSAEKDQEKLIRAFARIHRANSQTRLLILGDGPLQYQLMNVVKELGLQQSVHLLGRKANPYPYLMRADCFVLSSNYEGQPVVLYEALTLDKPIIATDIVSNHGVLRGGYGELCDNSIEGLEKAMHDYLAGKLDFKQFDIEAYNQRALDMFYKNALDEETAVKQS